MLDQAFASGWIAPAGPDLDAFEAELALKLSVPHVLAVASGTAALHLALRIVGVSPGDDVLISAHTFAAPAFAACYLGARPCIVDIDPATWQIDAGLVAEELDRRARRGALPKAVIAVDLYGSTPDLVALRNACDQYEVALVEDAAEAIGTRLCGQYAGTFGHLGVLSFNGNKLLTTGGGGALVTDDPVLVERARVLANQARLPSLDYLHEDVGYNYRLGNLAAALGRGQLATLPTRLANRARVHRRYRDRLASEPAIAFQTTVPDCVTNHWLTTVKVNETATGEATAVLMKLRESGIEARPGFRPLQLQPVFASSPFIGPGISTRIAPQCISLPSGGRLTDDDIDEIAGIISSTIG